MRIKDQSYIRQREAVEQLQQLLKDMQRISDMIWRLSVLYMPAWQDMTAANRSVRHALYLLDDSGMSEHIMEKRWGV